MLLLLIVDSNLTDGVPQGQRLLSMVGHPKGQVLSILVEGQLAVPEHTVQVVPGPTTNVDRHVTCGPDAAPHSQFR